MRAPIVLAVLALALMAMPAGADGCVVGRTPVVYTAQTDVGTFYVHANASATGGAECPSSLCVWTQVWEETNGIPGLQRVSDTCDGQVPADEKIAG